MKTFKWCLLLTAIALVVASRPVAAQGYFELVLEADTAYNGQQWDEAIELYDRAFSIQQPRPLDFYNAACCAALAGKSSKALSLLRKAVDSGWADFKWMEVDSDLSALKEGPNWEEELEELRLRHEKYNSGLDDQLRAELLDIFHRDQDNRREIAVTLKKFGSDSAEMQLLKAKIKESDRRNQERVLAIIDDIGWPGRDLVGPEGSQTVFLVIQHAPLEIQERYLPMARQAVSDFDLDPADLALLEDRILGRKDLPQIYGSQVHCDPRTWEDCHVLPIRDEASVNARRARVGLEPLENYLMQWNIQWPPPRVGDAPIQQDSRP